MDGAHIYVQKNLDKPVCEVVMWIVETPKLQALEGCVWR